MSLPQENHQPPDAGDDRLIDRLVDGELPDGERRELLLRLGTEPDGWRRCALAFLEAQTWREALRPLADSGPPPAARPQGIAGRRGRTSRAWRPVTRLVGLDAGLAVAFALGWAFRGKSAGEAPETPVAQAEAPAPTPPRPAPLGPEPRDSGPPGPVKPPVPLDPVVKQWEQRGYQAETQKRVISMELKDGRKVNVPVQEVRLRYVGDRTY